MFKIYYFGMIAHIRSSAAAKKFAVVSKASQGHHRFVLVLQGRPEIPLSADVTFSLTPGPAHVEPAFKKFVPPLQTILGSSLRPDIDHRTATDVYYIDYPDGGKLDVAELYGCRAEHKGNGASKRKDAVARLTYLSVDTKGAAVTVHSGSVHETVGPDACILIANYAMHSGPIHRCGMNASHGHFRDYEALMVNAEAGEAIELPASIPQIPFPHSECSWIHDYIHAPHFHSRTSVHIECGNSSYP